MPESWLKYIFSRLGTDKESRIKGSGGIQIDKNDTCIQEMQKKVPSVDDRMLVGVRFNTELFGIKREKTN